MLRRTDAPLTQGQVDDALLAKCLLVFARRGEQILRERERQQNENRPTLGSGGDSQGDCATVVAGDTADAN